ncbi:MAG: potassium channel family protein [Candidatus Methylumidiphilus sp.]
MESSNMLRVRLVLPAALVVTVTVVGTLGYAWLGRAQGATWLDALFMTVTTITTIGYGEIIHLTSVGRIFTMFIAIFGIASLFYSLTIVMDYLVSRRVSDPLGAKRMQREIDKLKSHIIIAGLGRVGKQAASELFESNIPFVIIDPGTDAQHYAHQHGYLHYLGDASDDEVLMKAGIARANGLIVTTGDDANNLYIVLSARVLKADLYIVSRAVDDASIPKLERAGANRAISPYAIGGRRLAHLILSPAVVDFFDTVIKRDEQSLNLEGIKVPAGANVIGQSLASLDAQGRTGASILIILRDKNVLPNPDPETILCANDQLLALGTVEELDVLESMISP